MRCELMRGGATFAVIGRGWAEIHPVRGLPKVLQRFRALASGKDATAREAYEAVRALKAFRSYIEREKGK